MKDGKLREVYPFVDWNVLFGQMGKYPVMATKQKHLSQSVFRNSSAVITGSVAFLKSCKFLVRKN